MKKRIQLLKLLLILILFLLSCKEDISKISEDNKNEIVQDLDNFSVKLDLTQNSIDQYTKNSLLIVTSSWHVGSQINKKVIDTNLGFLKGAGIRVVEINGSKMYPELKSLLSKFNTNDLPLTVLFLKGKPHKLPTNYDAKTFINFINLRLNR